VFLWRAMFLSLLMIDVRVLCCVVIQVLVEICAW
jgi:hypothetical protein